MFRAVYESTWYHPIFFWVAGIALLVAVARRLPFLPAYLVLFVIEILADATLTSPWSPVPANTRIATVVSVVFVVLGDARFFLLVERARLGALSRRVWVVALGLSVVVPMASFVPQALFPNAFTDTRIVFLTYETMFFVLALALRAWLPRRDWKRDADRRWATLATNFEIVQYALWAIADVIILAGLDFGYALRLVPNTMYYVFFLPFVAWAAPRELTKSWRPARA